MLSRGGIPMTDSVNASLTYSALRPVIGDVLKPVAIGIVVHRVEALDHRLHSIRQRIEPEYK